MKKLLFGLCLFLASISAYSQLGFEGLVVEKVPVTADALAADPTLPAGSIAYRVFVDMAPGWEFQAVYGDPENALIITSTGLFYNNADGVSGGRALPNFVFNNAAGRFDSYVTVDGVTTTRVGIPVAEDGDGTADGYVTGTSLALQSVGIDLDVPFGNANYSGTFSTNNGAYNVNGGEQGTTATNRVLIGQFTTTNDLSFELNIQIRNQTLMIVEKYVSVAPAGADEYFDARLKYTSAVVAPVVSITAPANGAAFNTGDVVTILANATDANGTVTKVEFFRNGVSIGTDVNGTDGWSLAWTSVAGAASFTAVATDNDLNATTSAAVSVTVTTPSNPAPTVSVTSPSAGQILNLGAAFTLTANATDAAPGTVTGVVFLNNGTPIAGSATQAGNVWSLSWTPATTGNISITARATDNGSASTTSAAVSAYVQDPTAGFEIQNVTAKCFESEVFCMPIRVTSALNNVIGFDIPLHYNRSKVHPTGVVYVKSGTGTLIANYNWVSTYVNIVDADSIMNISLAINGSAPAGTVFSGNGELICVEFARTIAFGSVNTANFSIPAPGIDVSYATKVDHLAVSAGTYTTYKDENYNSTLLFWKDNSPIKYVSGTNLITNIFGSTDCVTRLAPVQPDATGKFVYNTATAKNIKIVRDIASATDIQSVINGADAQLVARVVINDAGYKPNIYQMLAMDVNRDGLVSAGDVTQIMQRAVASYTEFKQTDNYNVDGSKIATKGVSKDWVFLPSDVIYGEQYRISESWPFTDGIGYSRYKVPVADTCHVVKIEGSVDCPIVPDRNYQGIMLGDVNGSYAGALESVTLKSTTSNVVVFDMANARIADGYAEIPIYFNSDEQVNSLDFSLQYDEENLTLKSVVKQVANLEAADHFNTSDRTLRFTSYSLKNLEAGQKLVLVSFATNSSVLKSTDLSSATAYVNGNPAAVKITEANGISSDVTVNIYPNPANSVINVEVSAAAKVVLMDMSGRNILYKSDAVANQKQEINVSGLADGMYMIKVYNNSYSTVKKVVVKK